MHGLKNLSARLRLKRNKSPGVNKNYFNFFTPLITTIFCLDGTFISDLGATEEEIKDVKPT